MEIPCIISSVDIDIDETFIETDEALEFYERAQNEIHVAAGRRDLDRARLLRVIWKGPDQRLIRPWGLVHRLSHGQNDSHD